MSEVQRWRGGEKGGEGREVRERKNRGRRPKNGARIEGEKERGKTEQDEDLFRREAALETSFSRREERAEDRGAPRVRSGGRNAGASAELFGCSERLHSPPSRPKTTTATTANDEREKRETMLSLSLIRALTALVDAVLVARDLPELGSDLVAALAGLQGHDLAHGGRGKERKEEGVESARRGKK